MSWKELDASPYTSMTQAKFLSLFESDKRETIRRLATEIATGLDTDGLIELIIGLHLGDDSPLIDVGIHDPEALVEIARDQLLIEEVGICKFCEDPVGVNYHLHQGGFVGDDCCWDERLRSTE